MSDEPLPPHLLAELLARCHAADFPSEESLRLAVLFIREVRRAEAQRGDDDE